MDNRQNEIEYAIREAKILYWSAMDSPSKEQIVNCAARLSGVPKSVVEKTYNKVLKVANINN